MHTGPSKDIKQVEGFEDAFKDLGQFVFSVGLKLATACEPFGVPTIVCFISEFILTGFTAAKHLSDHSLSLAQLISRQTTKARLLHYFPPSPENPLPSEDEPIDSWCGFHLDHSLLTGLCSVSLSLYMQMV